MNLIYLTCFIKPEYGIMANLFIQSLIHYYNTNRYELYIFVDNQTSTIVSTFLDECKTIQFKYKLIHVQVNTIFIAATYRVNIFSHIDINNFDKILYVDTDILISGSLDILFNIDIDNKIHVVKEVQTKPYHCLYHNNVEYEQHKEDCFSSGIILFDKTLKNYFEQVKHYMIYGINNNFLIGSCYDQPFFNYIAHKMNCFNNNSINQYTTCNPIGIIQPQIIHHFAGVVGHHESKLKKMNEFIIHNHLFL